MRASDVQISITLQRGVSAIISFNVSTFDKQSDYHLKVLSELDYKPTAVYISGVAIRAQSISDGKSP